MAGAQAAPPQQQAQANASGQFVNDLSAATGLNKVVIEAWVAVEGAYAPGGTGGYNYLNIREGTSHSGARITGTTTKGFAQFATPGDAAQEAAWMINHLSIYRGIKRSATMAPKSQLTAIAASPWDAGHYNGGKTLFSAYSSITSGGGGVLDAISGVGSAVAGGVNSVATAVVPGLGAAESAASSVGTLTEDAGKVIGFLFNPQDWLRIGYIIGGGLLTLGGLFIMAKSVGGSTTVQQAALMTTPEGRAAAASGLVPSRRPPEKKQAAPRTQTRTRTVYVTDPEENRRERVRRRAAAAKPSNDIPF